MRREIETVPKDGKLVILEDDARATYELARWSTEQSAWVGENGKPIPIAPTHWLPLQRDERLLPGGDEYLQREAESCGPPDHPIRHILPLSSDRAALEWPSAQEDAFALGKDSRAAVTFPGIEPRTTASEPAPPAWRRFAVSSIAAAMIASSLVGMYFRAPITAYVTQYADQLDIATIGRIWEQPSKQAIPLPIQEVQQAELLGRAPAVQPLGKSDGSGEEKAWDAAQTTMVSQATESSGIERRRADGLENEAELPPSTEGRALRLRDAASTAPQTQEPDREKASALLQALAAAREELTTNEVQYRKALADERDRSAALAGELATAQRNVEAQVVRANKTANEAAQLKKAADTTTSDLQRERERAEALVKELAKVRLEVEVLSTLSSHKNDEAAQLKKAADTTTSDLQRERERAEALVKELAKVRLEVEALSTLSSHKNDEAAQLKWVSETAIAELQQSLQQQRDMAQALESELAKVRQNADAQVVPALRKSNEEAARTKQIETVTSDLFGAPRRESALSQGAEYAKVELKPSLHQEQGKTKGIAPSAEPTRQVAGAVTTEQPVFIGSNGSEAAGLLARAKALLGQGNIGAARVVLERAAETGSAQATFALAETYDPNVLATWRTFGTRGDVMKARDLYARANEGGIEAAKDRSDALVAGDGGRKPASWFGREGDNR